MDVLRVEIWSDIACPWCYVGKRRLEAALAEFPHRPAVEVRWRAFELDPSAPRVQPPVRSYAERLAAKYRTSIQRAQGMIQRMTDIAAGDGLDFQFDRIRPGNTFDAHRVLHLAAERGKGEDAQERFLRAYLTEGAAIGDPETLVQLASQVGLDADEVRAVLSGDAHAREVRQDEAEAHALGIRGVPFFAIGGRYGISGAQPADILLDALSRAWSDLGGREDLGPGPACGAEGCEIPDRHVH